MEKQETTKSGRTIRDTYKEKTTWRSIIGKVENKMTNNNEKIGTKEFVVGALIGSVVGAAAAIWYTQKPRKDLKEAINEHTAAVKEKAGSLQKSALTKVSDLTAITRDKTNTLTQSLSQQSSELLSKLNNKNNSNDEKQAEFIPIGEEAPSVKKPKKMTVTAVGDERIQQMLSETKMAFDETERKLNQ
jgi:gas vesicle protein